MIDLIKLSLRLLRKHAALYAGCMVTVGATALISSMELGLVGGFSDPQVVVLPGVSDNELAVQLPMIRFVLYFLCSLAVTVSGFMMWSAVRQVVSFRHEELGLMRLAGASRAGLARMVLIECFAMGLVVALPCSILGALLTPVFFSALQLIHFFGSGVETQFPFSFAGIAAVTAVMSMLAALAGFVATLSATRGDPVAAASPMSARLSRWQLVWRLGVLAAGLYCAVLLDPRLLSQSLTLALPAMGVIPLVVVAPLCIPLGAQLIGRAVGRLLPGPGLLAAQRASKDRLRFARTAVPAIICVGALGSFLVANAPDEQARNEFNLSHIAASSVSVVRGADDADSAYSSLDAAQHTGGGAVARLSSPERRAATSSARSDLPFMLFYFADTAPLTRLVRQDVLEGDIEAVGGLDVASSIEGYHVGDTLTTRDRDGGSVTLRVVAVVDNPVYEGMFVDWREASRLVESAADLEVEVLASDLTAAQAEDVLKEAKVEVTVHSREAYVQKLEDERKSSTYISNMGVFGTIYLMSLISLAQSAVSANLARRREFSVLGSLGVDRKGAILLVATETIIVQAVAGALVALVLVILGLRYASLNGASPVAAIASAAPTTAVVYGTVLVLSLVFQVLGACIAWSRASCEV